MADNRGTRIPGNQPGFGYGMMPGMPHQFFQPGMQNYPMVQQPIMMGQGVAPQVFPMPQIPMVRPRPAPPPYTPQMAEAYKTKVGGPASLRGPVLSEEERKKAQYFQAQQQRLKQFGKGVPQTTFIPDDPTKLVDSIFGTNSAKPKPKSVASHEKREFPAETVQHGTGDDDGFGDFMEGPSLKTTSTCVAEHSDTASVALSQVDIEPQSPTAEQKDLMSLMMECSDLKQPAKARHFHKPSLKEVHVPHGQNKTFQQSYHSRCWSSTDELIGLFKSEIQSQPPPKQAKVRHHSGTKHVATTSAGLPVWCEASDDSLPAVYRQVLEAATGINGMIETDKLYPILLLSGLPREILGNIWQLANRENPGHVNRTELIAILALIALTQNNYSIASLEILTRCPQPPVPFLGQASMATAPTAAPCPDPAVASAGIASQVPSQLPLSASHVLPVSGQVPESQSHLPALPVVHAGSALPDTSMLGMVPALPSQPTPAPVLQNIAMPQPCSSIPAAPAPVLQNIPITNLTPQPCSSITVTSAVDSITQPTSVHHISEVFPQSGVSGFPVPPSQAPQPSSISSLLPAMPTTPPAPSLVQASSQSADDDDFADFQTAAAVKKSDDSFGEFIGSEKKPPNKENILHDATVPVSTELEEYVSFDDKYNSNIRSFFCSSDSSTGHTTPNSLEDEYTDCRDSSQVSTSEQSENEDIKAFESYVEEFNRKKDQQTKNFSPLHRPIAKKLPVAANLPTSIPSVPLPHNLTSDEFTDFKSAPVPAASSVETGPNKDTLYSAIQKLVSVQKVQVGDEDFSDFQEAPIKSDKIKPAPSGLNLLGEEDKYSALRAFDSLNTTVAPSLFNDSADSADGGFANFEEAEENEDDWAAFTEAEPAQPSTNTEDQARDSLTVPGLTSMGSMPQLGEDSNVTGLTSVQSAPVLSNVVGSLSKPQVDTASFFGAIPCLTDSLHTSVEQASMLSLYGSECGKDDDDWADFEGATAPSSDNLPRSTFNVAAPTPKMGRTSLYEAESNDKTGHLDGLKDKTVLSQKFGGEEFHSNGSLSNMDSFPISDNQQDKTVDSFPQLTDLSSSENCKTSDLLTIKKTNLPSDEILGVFKMREDPSVLARLKRPSPPKVIPESPKSKRMPSQESDIDDDRLPPPMDFPDEEEDHNAFSRGYDGLDEIVNKPVVTTSNPYSHHNSLATLYTTSTFSKNKHLTKTVGSGQSSQDHMSLAGERPDDIDSCSSRDQDSWTWKERLEGSREDSQSISSLDLNQRVNANHKDSDSGGTDSQSVSSAEFGNFESSCKVPAESKSVDSLDLKNEPQLDEESPGYPTGALPNPVTGSSFPSVAAQNLVTGRMRALADRYNIGDEVQGSNNHEYEWERCLDNSCRMIQDANTVFNSVSSSSVCNEVIRSSHGADYVTGIIEIYKVVCRIMAAMMSSGIKTPALEKLLKDIDLSWNNLTAFLMGASILPDPKTLDFFHATIKSDSDIAQEKSCGVCLLNVDVKDKTLNDENGVSKLTYGGRQYHAPCANFWVNCVDSTLPALRLPELL